MKPVYYLFSLIALLFFSFAFRPLFSPEDGLVAYYSFNSCDARDDSGNGSDGRLFGNVGCWCGIEDDGLLLDGIDDYIEFNGVVNRYFSTSDFTLSFYVKPEQYLLFRQSLLSKRANCTQEHMLDLLLNLGQGQMETYVHESEFKYYPGLSPSVEKGGWMHFALVREGFRASTYINGQLRQQSFRCSGVDIGNEALLSFSNSPCLAEGARRFKGVIDELRVYDRALTEQEVRSLYEMYPVENALQDCVTFVPNKSLDPLFDYTENRYYCATFMM